MRHVIDIACGCGDYNTQDPNDAHFDVPGHQPADIETASPYDSRTTRKPWNMFDESQNFYIHLIADERPAECEVGPEVYASRDHTAVTCPICKEAL